MPLISYDTSLGLDFLIFKSEDNELRHRVPLRPNEIIDPKHLNTVCDKEPRLNIIHINIIIIIIQKSRGYWMKEMVLSTEYY